MKEFLNKKISVKAVLILLTVIVIAAFALAALPGQISALLSPNVKITYDGAVQTPRDVNGNVVYPINYNGGIYLPVRGIANVFGIGVEWDNDTKTVMLSGAQAAVEPTQSGVIPGGGGQLRVVGGTRHTLIPEQSGIWSIRTSECGNADPMLKVLDSNGRLIAIDDDSNWELNALVFIKLDAGSEYTVDVTFYGSSSGSCLLTAAPALILPSGGGSVTVDGTTAYVFTPERSGEWTFRTSDNGECDPHLLLYDAHGNYIDEDDDSGGDMNAELIVTLTAGTTYILDADIYFGLSGSYTLTVS